MEHSEQRNYTPEGGVCQVEEWNEPPSWAARVMMVVDLARGFRPPSLDFGCLTVLKAGRAGSFVASL
jgi:hypothetical protein